VVEAAAMIGESWTAAEDERLRALWADLAVSAGAIGREIGRSKNSIVGRAHRLGLPARPSPLGPALRPASGLVWTAARNALLREGWPEGVPAADLLAAVNALPGPLVANSRAVMSQARYLKLPHRRRAVEAVWTGERDALLRARWPRGEAPESLLDAVSDLPGEPIASTSALIARVRHLGLYRDRDALTVTQQRARWPRPAPPPVVVPIRLAAGGGHGCQYVTDDTPYAQRFCEAVRAAGSSYCSEHHEICHVRVLPALTKLPWRGW
jgi:GcrA cell cycle regulator